MKLTKERIAYAKSEIKQRVQLSQLVETMTGTKLVRGKMLCPLHNEKTPSFHVDDNKGYYCQGCHAKGDAIGFVMQYQNLTFVESIVYIDNLLNLGLLNARISIASQNTIRVSKRKQKDKERLEVANNVKYGELCLEYRLARLLVKKLEPLTAVWGEMLTRIAWLEWEMDKRM